MLNSRRFCGVALAGLLMALPGCGGPPQVIGDDECFKAVDALWTAVTSRRTELVDQTDQELDRLAAAGQLTPEGRAALREISDVARQGDWEDAARSLKRLIEAQRRTG